MALRRLQPDDEPAGSLLTGGQLDGDSDGWWAGAQRCFAGVALATALAAAAFAAQLAADVQQDAEELPAASLAKFTSPDEDFWQNSVAPAAPTIVGAVREPPLLSDVEEIPAGSLQKFPSPDEDLWDNPVNPAPATIYQELPYLEDAEETPAGSLHGAPDEDFWDNPVNPVPATLYQGLPYLPDLADDPAGSFHGAPDEDFWDNPVNPVPATLYQGLPYLPDLADDPAGSLHGAPDEDFWDNPVNPVPATIYQELPYLEDAEDVPAGSLHGPLEEDFWDNPVNPVPATIVGAVREPPLLSDVEDVPAGSLRKFVSPEEDFWQNPVPSGLGQNPLAPVPPYGPRTSGGGLPSFYQPLPYASGETADVLPPAAFPPDEDFWPPLALAPGGWQNPVAPGSCTTVGAVRPSADGPLLSDIEEVPAGSLYGVPEESEWQNRVAPVSPTLFQRLPYLPEVSDDPAGSLYGVAEESEWQNPQITQIAQLAARIFQPLPYASGEIAEIPPTIVSDDDCWPPLAIAAGGWQSSIIPAYAAGAWMQPAVYGSDEFSSFWWTQTWGMRTHSAARARVSHSAARKRSSRSTARPRTSRGISRQSSVISNQ
jgi:hypothetical protein